MSDMVLDLDVSDSNDGIPEAPSSRKGQIQPGISGNPRGRPRKSRNAQSAIEAALSEQVTIKDATGKKKITAAQAIGKRLVNQAMQGNIAAIKTIQRESPNFLTDVETDDDGGRSFMHHLVMSMSESALDEFRKALASWNKRPGKRSKT